nr:hypothetical protein 12 [Desulfobulbaceae bacterium]
MADKNRIELTGNVEQLQRIETRSGKPMAKWLLQVGGDRFWCVSFGNLAELVLNLGNGTEVGVVGTASINSWQDDDGNWKNDFQATAWSVEAGGVAVSYERLSKLDIPLHDCGGNCDCSDGPESTNCKGRCSTLAPDQNEKQREQDVNDRVQKEIREAVREPFNPDGPGGPF